jgi:hypothetical protein
MAPFRTNIGVMDTYYHAPPPHEPDDVTIELSDLLLFAHGAAGVEWVKRSKNMLVQEGVPEGAWAPKGL